MTKYYSSTSPSTITVVIVFDLLFPKVSSNHIPQLPPLLSGSRIREEEQFSEEEVSYIKQGEEALQRAIGILSEQDGWTTEIADVSKRSPCHRCLRGPEQIPKKKTSGVCSNPSAGQRRQGPE